MKTNFSRFLSAFLCALLIVAMAVMCIGCGGAKTDVADTTDDTAEVTTVAEEDKASVELPKDADGNYLVGEGDTQFTFVVVLADGTETTFVVSTDETTVGAALLGAGLIAGEDSESGLYVKDVRGETHDYDVDGTYWSFLIDGEYAMTGVDATDIEAGVTYSFVVAQG